MTNKTMTLQRAAELLREEALIIKETHANGLNWREGVDDWSGEPEAKEKYDELLAAADVVSHVSAGWFVRLMY